jgi:phosphomannomutase
MPSSSLVVSYSGVRGLVGVDLTKETARAFGYAFGQMVKARTSAAHPHILVGRDSRPSGPMLREGLIQGLSAHGVHVIEAGVVATPTLQFGVKSLGAHAGSMITASHNPQPWNGFKFFLGPESTVLDAEQTRELLEEYQKALKSMPPAIATVVECHAKLVEQHVSKVLKQVNVEAIRRSGFRAAVDSGGGAGEEPAMALLHALNVETIVVSSARESEPVPEHLEDLAERVQSMRCHVGFAQDLDADRLALVTEEGYAPGEDYTLVLAVDHLLSRAGVSHAAVVKNIATTGALDEVAAKHGAEIVETRVGEINLSRVLLSLTANGKFAIGGEGNGGVILPAVCPGRDSITGIALVLEAMAESGKPLSEMLQALPQKKVMKVKCPVPEGSVLDEIWRRIEVEFAGNAIDRLDGIRVKFKHGAWVLARASNTEPVLRVIVESQSEQWNAAQVKRMMAIVSSAPQTQNE